MNGTHENCLEKGLKDTSPSLSPTVCFDNQSKKAAENNDSKTSFVCCDICEKCEFSSEMELATHKKLFHHKLPSPGKVSVRVILRIWLYYSASIFIHVYCKFCAYLQQNEQTDNAEAKISKHKSGSSAPSPTLRYENNKKMETFNGETNGNNGTSCGELYEKQRDFGNETELASHKKLIHHMKLSSPRRVSVIILKWQSKRK